MAMDSKGRSAQRIINSLEYFKKAVDRHTDKKLVYNMLFADKLQQKWRGVEFLLYSNDTVQLEMGFSPIMGYEHFLRLLLLTLSNNYLPSLVADVVPLDDKGHISFGAMDYRFKDANGIELVADSLGKTTSEVQYETIEFSNSKSAMLFTTFFQIMKEVFKKEVANKTMDDSIISLCRFDKLEKKLFEEITKQHVL